MRLPLSYVYLIIYILFTVPTPHSGLWHRLTSFEWPLQVDEELNTQISHTVFTEFVIVHLNMNQSGFQAVAAYLLDEYLLKSDELRHNFNKIGQ